MGDELATPMQTPLPLLWSAKLTSLFLAILFRSCLDQVVAAILLVSLFWALVVPER